MVPKTTARKSDPDFLFHVVTRSIMAVLLGCSLTVILDPGSVNSYPNEVEYARAKPEKLQNGTPWRCNDRLEDFIQV